MNKLLNYPQDVIDFIKTWNVDFPSDEILSEILSVCFYAGCEREEGRYATFAVQLRDKETVEKYYRFRFDKPKEYTVPVLTKLASAIDYRQSSIGIRENDNQLEIFGIMRHGTMAHRFKQGEFFFGGVAMGSMMDNCLRVIVHGPGQMLKITKEKEKMQTLFYNHLGQGIGQLQGFVFRILTLLP